MHFELVRPDEPVQLPIRKTLYSAGYDFFLPQDTTIPAHGQVLIPTNVTLKRDGDLSIPWLLQIYPRSSYGTKKGLVLANTVGIIDEDYCGFEIFICLYNRSDVDVALKAGDSFVQGVFVRYLTTSDDQASGIRTGGFGSTGR